MLTLTNTKNIRIRLISQILSYIVHHDVNTQIYSIHLSVIELLNRCYTCVIFSGLKHGTVVYLENISPCEL